jgi:fluoride exporter
VTGLWVSLAGALGAVSRLLIDGAINRRIRSGFPWSTFIINVSGSLLLGVVTGLILFHHDPPDLKLIIGAGFCGGYTTFSTASFESVRLLQRRTYGAALANIVGTMVVTMGAAAVGLAAVRP